MIVAGIDVGSLTAKAVILDDNRSREYPDSIWYLPEPLSAQAPLRAGSLLHGVEGILHHAWGWRLQLTEKIEHIEQAPRPSAPELPDGVRVEGGHIVMPDLPGIGFEGKSDLYAEMKALAA